MRGEIADAAGCGAAILAGLALALGGAGIACADGPPPGGGAAAGASLRVRVLVHRGPGPVRVGVRGHAPLEVEADPEGVRVVGRGVVGSLRLGPGPVRVKDVWYRGTLEVRPGREGLDVINRVDLESYVAGTLMREVYPAWDDAVLRAQAVVARTYALHEMRRHRADAFDLTADARSQVYGGLAAEMPRAWEAVEATRGEYLAFRGEPILAVYHSASGGRTASSEEVWGEARPYLVSREVVGEDASPASRWRTELSAEELGEALAELGIRVGRPRELRVERRSRSGRAASLRVRGARGEARLSARALRRALGTSRVRSTRFDVRGEGGRFVIEGAGAGHGVGMSQWGARAMAARGAHYREILAAFYPGTALERLGPAEVAAEGSP